MFLFHMAAQIPEQTPALSHEARPRTLCERDQKKKTLDWHTSEAVVDPEISIMPALSRLPSSKMYVPAEEPPFGYYQLQASV